MHAVPSARISGIAIRSAAHAAPSSSRLQRAGALLLLVVTGGVLADLGRRFWRAHSALTLLAIGAIQASLALWIAGLPLGAAVSQ